MIKIQAKAKLSPRASKLMAILKNNNKKKLNERQKRYIQGRVQGQNKKDAALAAGYSPKTAANAKNVIENKEAIQGNPGIIKALEELGVNDLKLAQGINELLEKREAELVMEYIGEKAVRARRITERPDAYAVKSGLELAFKLRGDFSPDKVQITRPYENLDEEELDRRILEAKKKGEK